MSFPLTLKSVAPICNNLGVSNEFSTDHLLHCAKLFEADGVYRIQGQTFLLKSTWGKTKGAKGKREVKPLALGKGSAPIDINCRVIHSSCFLKTPADQVLVTAEVSETHASVSDVSASTSKTKEPAQEPKKDEGAHKTSLREQEPKKDERAPKTSLGAQEPKKDERDPETSLGAQEHKKNERDHNTFLRAQEQKKNEQGWLTQHKFENGRVVFSIPTEQDVLCWTQRLRGQMTSKASSYSVKCDSSFEYASSVKGPTL